MFPLSTPLPTPPTPANALASLAHVWRAGEMAGGALDAAVFSSSYPALDAALPGGGWPLGALTELLQAQAGLHEWGVLVPGLAALLSAQSAQSAQAVVLVGAPHGPFGPALSARQLAMPRLLSVLAARPPPSASPDNPALLWATREALQCADVAAVLAWLPQARGAHLRRLQIAAHTHGKALFVFRLLGARHESSPAPLRLLLAPSSLAPANVAVDVFKRRGPPLAAPLLLDTRPARLSALLAASKQRRGPAQPVRPSQSEGVDLSHLLRKPLYALDSLADALAH